MDFITFFPSTVKQHDAIMVVVDRLKKVLHFILVKTTYSASGVAQVFIRYIFIFHDVPNMIVLDRDSKLTSKYWKEFFGGFGTYFQYNLSFTDRWTDREGQQDIGGHVEDVCDASTMEVGILSTIG